LSVYKFQAFFVEIRGLGQPKVTTSSNSSEISDRFVINQCLKIHKT